MTTKLIRDCSDHFLHVPHITLVTHAHYIYFSIAVLCVPFTLTNQIVVGGQLINMLALVPQELDTEVQDKSVLVCALESTGLNIQGEMELKGVEPGDMPAQVADVRSRWEELRKSIATHMAEIGASSEQFDRFLSSMTSFVNWLSEFHSKLYDEVCVQIPPKAKNELVSHHKNQLEVFRAEVSTYAPKLERLKVGCEVWSEYLVPEDAMDDLPSPSEPSPAPDGREPEEVSDVHQHKMMCMQHTSCRKG